MDNGKIVIHILQKCFKKTLPLPARLADTWQAVMNSEPEALFIATKQEDVLVANG